MGKNEEMQETEGLETRFQLVAGVAHDLRTPLVAIRGYTRMILEGRAGGINDTQREYLSIVADNTHRVIQLLNSLSKLTIDEEPLAPQGRQVFKHRDADTAKAL